MLGCRTISRNGEDVELGMCQMKTVAKLRKIG